jgi:16S rRNA (cytosine967-C5)-methyltransferase
VPSAACLQATLDLMHEVDRVARPADAVVSAWFRARRHIRDKERGHISDLLYALLRHHARLGWWLARHGRQSVPRNRLLAWLALDEGKTRDQVHSLFNGGKFAPAVLTDQERTLLVKLQGCPVDHPAMPDEVRGECPSWAVASLRRRFGDSFPREMAALLTAAPLDLRVNPLKSTREVVLRALRNLGLQAEASRMAPYGIRVNERPSLASLPMLRNGEVEIQDEGSQLVAMLVDARPGERVVDFCAGAGGKTLAIATQMANKGHVIACDVLANRLKRSAERFRRAGLHNIETKPLASEKDR